MTLLVLGDLREFDVCLVPHYKRGTVKPEGRWAASFRRTSLSDSRSV
jgi:hypothetical protein